VSCAAPDVVFAASERGGGHRSRVSIPADGGIEEKVMLAGKKSAVVTIPSFPALRLNPVGVLEEEDDSDEDCRALHLRDRVEVIPVGGGRAETGTIVFLTGGSNQFHSKFYAAAAFAASSESSDDYKIELIAVPSKRLVDSDGVRFAASGPHWNSILADGSIATARAMVATWLTNHHPKKKKKAKSKTKPQVNAPSYHALLTRFLDADEHS
jgi:hypothetical protein